MTSTVDALAAILARDHDLAPERLTADAVLEHAFVLLGDDG